MGEPQALDDIYRVLQMGVQVVWMEFEDYRSFMIYYEGIAVQGEVVVKPHIIDTALMFNSFSKRPSADGLCWRRQPQALMQRPTMVLAQWRRAIMLKPMWRVCFARTPNSLRMLCCQRNERQVEASLEGSKRNSTGH